MYLNICTELLQRSQNAMTFLYRSKLLWTRPIRACFKENSSLHISNSNL